MADKTISLDLARKIVEDALELTASELPDDASIDTLDRWDSLAHMRIMLALEECLDRELSAEKIISVESLNDISRLLADKL